MPRAKKPSKRKQQTATLPILGIAGISLSLAGGASASTSVPANLPSQCTQPPPTILLGEEEISDVSLGTFYVYDQENKSFGQDIILAQGGRGCGGGGARGCGGGGARGCGGGGARGCGGCGGARGCGGCGGARGCGCGGARGCRGCGARGCGVGGCGVRACAVACACGGCTGSCWLWTPAGWVYTC